jgi:hypothetical protein
MRGALALAAVALVASCTGAERAPAPKAATTDSAIAVPVATLPPASDSVATIAALQLTADAIERDSARFDVIATPLALGAGADALVTAWRLGNVWTRVRVEGEGAGFRTTDNYWLNDGVLMGARLAIVRDGRRPAIDQVWFRDRALYRWTDAAGRRLNPAARSTQYEVRMLRARFDTLMRRLTTAELRRR